MKHPYEGEPCANPECDGVVEYRKGLPYCSKYCDAPPEVQAKFRSQEKK